MSQWLPGVSGGGRITIRQLLSHTAGLQEYGPQEYMLPENTQPLTPQAIVDCWGKKALDFDPASQWQYQTLLKRNSPSRHNVMWAGIRISTSRVSSIGVRRRRVRH